MVLIDGKKEAALLREELKKDVKDVAYNKLVIKNIPFHYTSIKKNLDDVCFKGWFQSEKYFLPNYKKIYRLMHPPIALDRNQSEEIRYQMGTISVKKFPMWGLCSRCNALSRFDTM